MTERPYKERLPRRIKIGYGTAEFGTVAVEFFLRLYLLIFYTDVVGLRADLAGYAVALAIIWDAITDPLMGSISDRTRSRFGKRRPYIVLGGITLAISIFVLFSPPHIHSQAGKFIFLLLSYIILNTCYTIVCVPHVALGGELTFDRDERTELFGWKFLFFNLGGLFGSAVPGLLLASVETQKNLGPKAVLGLKESAFSTSAYIIGAAMIATALITVFTTRGLDKPAKESGEPFGLVTYFKSWKTVMQNKLFAILVSAYVVATIGLSINGATAIYYYKYTLGLTELQLQYVIVVFLLTISFSIPLWIWAAQKYGKKWPGFWGVFILGVIVTVSYPFLPAKQISFPISVAIIAGIFTGTVALLDALVADIVDYDELATGEHREGLYFGFWKLASKIARAVSVAIAGKALTMIGFVPNQVQTPDVSWKIGLLFGPGVGLFFIFGALIFMKMPYTNEDHHRVQEELLMRKIQQSPEAS